MKNQTPAQLISNLIEARARRDVDAAVACYEAYATVMVAPGKTMTGTSAVRAFTEAVMELPLVFSARTFVEGHDTAIHYSRWTVTTGSGDDAVQRAGSTTDLVRKQPDGSWLLAIDNAWGAAILDEVSEG